MSHRCPKLKCLNISRCKNLESKATACAIAKYCTDVEYLSMGSILLFSEDISLILHHCQKVKMLNLGWVAGSPSITIVSKELRTLKVFGSCFEELVIDCPKLIRLDCSACMDLTSIRLSTSTASSVREIDFYGCAMISEREFEEFFAAPSSTMEGEGRAAIEVECREREDGLKKQIEKDRRMHGDEEGKNLLAQLEGIASDLARHVETLTGAPQLLQKQHQQQQRQQSAGGAAMHCFARLKSLHLGCTGLTYGILERIIACCPSLLSLSLVRCRTF